MIALADLKAWLGITASTDDSLLTALETRAVAYLQEQTGRFFGATENTTEIVPGSGMRDLWLAEPAGALPTTVAETAYPGATVTTITAANEDGYELRTGGHESRLVRKGGYTWTYGYEYTVAYSRGYAAGAEPGDIRQAVMELCRLAYHAKDTAGATGGILSETIGNYSYRLADASASGDATARAAAWGIEATIAHWTRVDP